MAKLIYAAITSLDGYVADEDGNFDWSEPDEDVHSLVNDLERPTGTHLYGRRLYDVMVAWETIDDEQPVIRDYAEIWRAADKVVYSRSLETVSSARTRIERSFDPDVIRRMKLEAERDISVGGPSSPRRRSGRGWSTRSSCSSRPSWWAGGHGLFRTTPGWISSCWRSAVSTTASCTSATEPRSSSDRGRHSDSDDDLPSHLSRFQIADRLGNLAQRECPVDDRRDLPGFDEVLQDDQAVTWILGAAEGMQVAHER
jgi:dihydrofolate reductase